MASAVLDLCIFVLSELAFGSSARVALLTIQRGHHFTSLLPTTVQPATTILSTPLRAPSKYT